MEAKHWIVPENYHVLLGGNRYINCGALVTYKGESLFDLKRSSRDDFLGVNFDLYAAGGTKVATIRNSRFVDYDDAGYEISRTHDDFTLRETSTNRVVCNLKLRENAAGPAEVEVTAEMHMPDGSVLKFDKDATNIGGLQMTGCTMENCGTALAIE